jgi:hypothetical protein
VKFESLPMIHGAAALQAGSATKAIDALAPAVPHEAGDIAQTLSAVRLTGYKFLAPRRLPISFL